MTIDNIIELAKQAGLVSVNYTPDAADEIVLEELRLFATLVRNAALEEAADVVDNADTPDCGGWTASGISDEIRAMKEQA